MPALILVLVLGLAQVAGAQSLWPGAAHDPGVPTLERVVGHDFGTEISSPEQIVRYLEALAAAAPDRTRLVRYGETWQRRPLYVFVIAGRDRIGRLDALKGDLRRLADPRTLAAGEAEALVRSLPVVTWLMHGVHGNEISSSDAALATAYHLLAARGDRTVDEILAHSIVVIDPLQNPDGRARFLQQHAQGRAAAPDPEPLAAEHDEPWPGGRTNHYLFDMNRDWVAQTQPESIARTRLYREWFPHVVVDLHEMGGNGTYYFAPPAAPANPHLTPRQHEWMETIGRANAARFDARGFAYFIRETYDTFYPGYGDTWPSFQGAIGMTYEQASARGLRWRRRDGTILSYHDGVLHHVTAAITTAHTAASNREALLRDFHAYHADTIAEGEKGPVRGYLLPPGRDPSRAARLARLLRAQGIEVGELDAEVREQERTFPAGTFVVSLAQPLGRLARTLMDEETPLENAFVEEQDRRRRKRLPDQIYDITAWSLPLMFGVESVAVGRLPTNVRAWSDAASPGAPALVPEARVGYLLPWGVATASVVTEALGRGLRVDVAGRPFTLSGRAYPAGTAIFRTATNPPRLRDDLSALAARHQVTPIPTDTAWVDDGISLGSGQVASLKAPRVVLAWDAPTQAASAGATRFVLERVYQQPVTTVRVATLPRLDLRHYDVLVLPSGDYGSTLGEDALRRLKDWIRAGGTLITLGEASRWAARSRVGLLETTTLLRNGEPEGEDQEDAEEGDDSDEQDDGETLEEAIQPRRERPEAISGALLRVELDEEHWLAAGVGPIVYGLVEGARVFRPIPLDEGRNVGVYSESTDLVASGLVWPEARDLLARKAFLIHQPLGDGHVIAFAEDPNFRGLSAVGQLLFMNAVLIGPAQ